MVAGINGMTGVPPVLTMYSVVVLEVVLWASMFILFSLLPTSLTLDGRGRFSWLLAAASSFLDDILLVCMGYMM